MNTPASEQSLTFEPNDARRLASLCGEFNTHIKQIEQRLKVDVHQRGNVFALSGDTQQADAAKKILSELYSLTESKRSLDADEVHLVIRESGMEVRDNAQVDQAIERASIIKTKKNTVKPRGDNQRSYVARVRGHDINFGIGPAGTGKTYLAVACAVEALINDEVERILLVRPAVEAGEKLGFLPGDLAQKVDPYLRPLYDALYEMLGFEVVGKLIEKGVIEIAPLAYMRGRTLNNSFVILDESQNTTREQMKMFLTRIGFGTTAVITGDPSQVDLPRGQFSGLAHAIDVLNEVSEVSFTHFDSKDVVRHSIVQSIVEAYAAAEALQAKIEQKRRAQREQEKDQ